MTRYFVMKYNPATDQDIDITDFSYSTRRAAVDMMIELNRFYEVASFAFRVVALPAAA